MKDQDAMRDQAKETRLRRPDSGTTDMTFVLGAVAVLHTKDMRDVDH